jgi:hypothetical protein
MASLSSSAGSCDALNTLGIQLFAINTQSFFKKLRRVQGRSLNNAQQQHEMRLEEDYQQ